MAEATKPAPKKRGRKPLEDPSKRRSELPRLNIALDAELYTFAKTMADYKHISATEYVRQLIEADFKKNRERYEELNKMFGTR